MYPKKVCDTIPNAAAVVQTTAKEKAPTNRSLSIISLIGERRNIGMWEGRGTLTGSRQQRAGLALRRFECDLKDQIIL